MEFQIARLCVVCQDTASGIHYRVLTCEGCKGFWRRTIQRGMGPVYQCRQGAERCAVTPQSRGRCQRCRYLACVAAGMVADLVMSDRERIVKAKEVVNNRVRKEAPEQRSGGRPVNSRDQEGQRLLTVAAALHQRFLATREVLGENQNIHKTIAAASNFLELFLAELMGGRFILELMKSAHMEVVLIHLAVSRPASSLAALPLLAQLADHASSLTYQEVVLAQAVAATRPRLSWPPPDRYKLGEIWDILAEAVRRWSGAERLPCLLQLVMQAAFACCYIPQETLVACLQPRQWGDQQGGGGWGQYNKVQGGYPGGEQGEYQGNNDDMYEGNSTGIYPEAKTGIYPEAKTGIYPEAKTGMYPEAKTGIYSGGVQTTYLSPTASYVPAGAHSPTESYISAGSESPETIGITRNPPETIGISSKVPETIGIRGAVKETIVVQQDVRLPQPPSHLSTIYKEVDYDLYSASWRGGGGSKLVKEAAQAGAGTRPLSATYNEAQGGDDIIVPGSEDVSAPEKDVIVPDNVIVPNMITSDNPDFAEAQVPSKKLLEPSSKKRKYEDLDDSGQDNSRVIRQNSDVLKQALLGVF